MRLVVEGLTQPRLFQVQEDSLSVSVSHFSLFDADSNETEDMSLLLSKDAYQAGLRELKESGTCRIPGAHGDLVLRSHSDGPLSVSMIGEHKTIDLSRFPFGVED